MSDEYFCAYCGMRLPWADFDHSIAGCADHLLTRAEAAEQKLRELQERTRWRKYPDEKPDSDEDIHEVYCFRKWTGNEYEEYSRSYWCEFTLLDTDETFYDVCQYNFQGGAWEKRYEGEDIHPIVTRYTLLPEPPEDEDKQ